MKRKLKVTSIDGAVRAIKNATAAPFASPWPLSADQRPIWNEIISRRSRDEWDEVDLRFVWDLSEVLCRLKEEKIHLQKEGFILDGLHGAKINPRAHVVRSLSGQARDIARYLRIHPASEAEHPTKVIVGRKAEKEARAIVNEPKPDLLPVQ